MVRSTTRDDESAKNASVSVPDYRETGVDLVDVSPGDRIEFTTTTKRSNGVPLRKAKTLTVDDVTVDEVEDTELVEVDPSWLPDDGPFGCDDDVAAASVPRDVTKTKVSVVAIDDGTRYTLRQTDTGFVRVSSCEQSDYVDQNERGEFNAVARSNVSHGTLSSWSHTPVVTDGGEPVDDDPNRYPAADAVRHVDEGDTVIVAYDSTQGGDVTKHGEVTHVDGGTFEFATVDDDHYRVSRNGIKTLGPKRDVTIGRGVVVTIAADTDRDAYDLEFDEGDDVVVDDPKHGDTYGTVVGKGTYGYDVEYARSGLRKTVSASRVRARDAATDGGIDDVPEVVDVDEDDRYPSVARWEWEGSDTGVVWLAGYDDDGTKVAERTFKHSYTKVRSGDDFVDANDHDDGGWSPSDVFKPDDLTRRDVREDDVVEVRYDPPRDAHPRQTLRFRIVSVAGGTAGVVSGPTPGGDRIRVWRDDAEVTRNGTTLGDVVSFEVVGRVPDANDDEDDDPELVTDGGYDVGDTVDTGSMPSINTRDFDRGDRVVVYGVGNDGTVVDVTTGTFDGKRSSKQPNRYASVMKHTIAVDADEGGRVAITYTESHEPQTRHYPGSHDVTLPTYTPPGEDDPVVAHAIEPADEDDDAVLVADGGIDRCDECGRYAAHTFDHAPSCTSYTPIEAEPDVDGTDLRSRDHDTLRARLAALEDAKARAVDTGSERRYRRIDDREEAVRAELVRRAATREGAV